VGQRCKKWWNRGTRFPESELACRKFLGPRREIVETITADLSAENSAEFVKNYADYYVTDEHFNINCF
jgi:hypothetical protein